MSFEPKATYPPADALYESTEEKKARLTSEISELAGKVEMLQDEYERYEQQAGIAARNAREIAHKGGPGHLQVSEMMAKSARAKRDVGQARLELEKKRKELYAITGESFPEIPVSDYTWDEWWWSWLGYKPERKYV